jgi:uncharacterized surface protein with fasciclin (FAS1) repeats
MKLNLKHKMTSKLSIVMLLVTMMSCNKDVPAPVPVTFPPPNSGTTPTLATLLDAPDMSILKAAVTRAGLMPSLTNTSLRFTVFAPNDAAMASSGITLAAVNALPLTSLVPLIQYHVVPQTILAANIPTTFPNLQYPSLFNPAPSVSAILRLTTFPSKRGSAAWVNTIPVTATDIVAVNGVMHKVALVVAPPSRFLWDRINTDTDLTYLKAAIQRADSGVVAASTLQGALGNIGANLTVFAPTNAAFQSLIFGLAYRGYLSTRTLPYTAIDSATANAVATGAVAAGPAFLNTNNVSTTLVRGIVVYHVFGSRAFTNNFPTSATLYPTLLNGAIKEHPGLSLTATFTGPSVSAATVKGVANATAATIAINPTPEPGGSSDQHYLNGTIHKINQVLLPQ